MFIPILARIYEATMRRSPIAAISLAFVAN
jgi:hypothetical protein